MIQKCEFCPRMCKIQREGARGKGLCGGGENPIISAASLHMWEEPVISGTAGSGTIFFSGCSLRCVFCQNHTISSRLCGREVTSDELAAIMRGLEERGAHNISFVTGTHYCSAIIEALRLYRPNIPLVWNSGGYERFETIRALSQYIDIWLPDYKFALKEVARRYADAPDYPETAFEAIRLMCEISGDSVVENGIMKRGVIVRHLVLPGNVRNSIAALRKIASGLPKGTLVSVMSQYIPSGDLSEYPELKRRITDREYEKVCDEADRLGLNGFFQELSSASGEYVPDFDLTEIS